MVSYVKYESAVEKLANKEIDAFGTTDTFKVVIHTDAPVAATDDELADLTQIGGSNGYTTNGEDVQNDATRAGGTVTFTGVDIIWTAVTGNLGSSTTGRYFSMFDDTATGDPLWSSWDFGTTFIVPVGETMTFDVGANIWTMT